MKRISILAASAVLAAFLVGAPASAQVAPGDTFTFSIAAFNSTGTSGFILGSGEQTTFGTTQTFAGIGYNGQDYTITSSQAVGATTTTDTFLISTPTNFLTTSSVNSVMMTALQFDIGTANSGVGVTTGANPVDFASAITSYTAAGYIIYGSANTVFNLTPSMNVLDGGLAFTAAEGVNTGTSAISGIGVHAFGFSITYANPVVVPPQSGVPEPANWALMLGGFGMVGGALRSRRKAAVSFG